MMMKIAPVCEVPVCRGERALTVLLGYQGGAPEFSYPTIFTFASKTAAHKSEPEFLNVYGAQESIPRNQFRQAV